MMKATKAHTQRIGLLVLNGLLNNRIVLGFAGVLNSRSAVIEGVFVGYPAREKYAAAYSYRWVRSWIRWRPYLIGAFRQGRKWGLLFAISATEERFTSSSQNDLADLVRRTEAIRDLVGARQKTFAGVLPGVLLSQGLIETCVEADVTVRAVLEAEQEARERESYGPGTPLIILGGMGFIGRRIVAALAHREVHCVDLDSAREARGWPSHLAGQRAIVVNVSRRAILLDYIPNFWPELVLVNEVYPEPGKREIAALRERGCRAYHVVGLEGRSFPRFPGAYRGGIPCCAGLKSAGARVVLERLV